MVHLLEQRDALGHQGFLSADGAHRFARLGFQADAIDRQVQHRGNALAHRQLEWRQLRLLGKDNTVEIHDPKTACGHLLPGCLQHLGRVAPPVRRVLVAKQFANIAQGGGTQQGIGQGVQKRVGIAVADGMPGTIDVDAAQP